jgi:hypothetical protein
VAFPAAEVVVDHLDDPGGAAGPDLDPGPQPGDPLAGGGYRPGDGGPADQHLGQPEQERVGAPTAPGLHGRDRSTR